MRRAAIILPSDPPVEVEMNEWESVETPEWLHTHGTFTCIAVAVLDNGRNAGHLLHAPGLGTGGDDLPRFLRSIGETSDDVTIVIAGGARARDCMATVDIDRRYVEEQVRAHFPNATPDIRWNKPGQSVTVAVIPAENRIEVITEPNPRRSGKAASDN